MKLDKLVQIQSQASPVGTTGCARICWVRELRFEAGRSELRSDAGRSKLIFEPGRGQSSGLRDAPCIVRLDGTVSIVKIVSLSPHVEKPKLKEGNKSFVPGLKKSRQSFGILTHVSIFTSVNLYI